jgi:hypothetical protein
MLGGVMLSRVGTWGGTISHRGRVLEDVACKEEVDQEVAVEEEDVVVVDNGVIVSIDKPRYQSVPTGDVSKILILVNYPRVPPPSRDLLIILHPRVSRTYYLLDF